MTTRNYTADKFDTGKNERSIDALIVEETLHININGDSFTLTMRTPGQDACLVRGLLHTEGILADSGYSPEIILQQENNAGIVTMVNLSIPENKIKSEFKGSRNLISSSSCGICGKTEIKDLFLSSMPLADNEKISIDLIETLFEKMNAFQHDFRHSGGSHAAAAFDKNGGLLCTMEDIGRHNAVDKVIGSLILKNVLDQAFYLTVSGRVSFEIVSKCYKAGIPVLAAVSAPSTLAVDFAEEVGITLLAFCRDQRATCYSNSYRILDNNKNSKAS